MVQLQGDQCSNYWRNCNLLYKRWRWSVPITIRAIPDTNSTILSSFILLSLPGMAPIVSARGHLHNVFTMPSKCCIRHSLENNFSHASESHWMPWVPLSHIKNELATGMCIRWLVRMTLTSRRFRPDKSRCFSMQCIINQQNLLRQDIMMVTGFNVFKKESDTFLADTTRY